MSSHVRLDTVAPWVEILCEAGTGPAQDRLLLECVLALGGARAAALWRRERGAHAGWRSVTSSGLVDLLPRRDEVEALANRSIPAEALPKKRVIVAGDALLALGGVDDPDDERLDWTASLFLTHALLRDDTVDVEDVAPALPRGLLESLGATDLSDTSSSVASTSDAHASGATERRSEPETATVRRARHDVRNVLASLRATQDLLENFSDGLTPDETRRFRAVVDEECRRAGEMVAQALLGSAAASDAAGHRAGGLCAAGLRAESLDVDACRAADVLEHVLDAEIAACEREGIVLRRLIDPNARASEIALSASDWARVAQNLLVNARQALASTTHARGPGTIWVTLEPATVHLAESRACVRLTVEDDGPGIPEEHVTRVFEDGFTSGKNGSSGQGLAIVRDFAVRAGGDVRVSRRALGGARIEVVLPVHAGAPHGWHPAP